MPSTWKWYVVPACASKVDVPPKGLRQITSPSPLGETAVSTATTVENGAVMVTESSPVVVGVNVYQTVLCDEDPEAQVGGRSSVSIVASVMSPVSLNGSAVISLALAKLSFPGATSWAVNGMRGCTGRSLVHDVTSAVKPASAAADW